MSTTKSRNPFKKFKNTPPALLPLMPMLYVAWSDGVLTPTELSTIREKLKAQRWLKSKEKELLKQWLDPASPPSTTELLSWLRTIKEAASKIRDTSRFSLVELGLAIAKSAGSPEARCTTPEAEAALVEIESALGIISQEAALDLLDVKKDRKKMEKAAAPSFDARKMQQVLDGDQKAIRDKVRRLLSDPIFSYRYDLSTELYREQVMSWLQELAKQGLGAISFPVKQNGGNDLGKFMAAFEMIALHDLSLTIKFGVQYGLFGGSILNLGTKKHHEKYLTRVGNLNMPGCFAMTELGHGSNVRDIETIARYDPGGEQFVIHTPRETARKEYIGNAARDGTYATVFAQLEIAGENYGVHAFIVPIRDDKRRALPGIKIGDSGIKMGLNGVDNGRLWFDNVRIPRENLLDRFAQVAADGSYTSSIVSTSQRFFTMLGTLVGGRISISAAALSAAKSAVTIAVRYAETRRQFGAPGEPETLLLDYPSHQLRLLPLVASVYAIDFAQKYLTFKYVNRSKKDSRKIEMLAAGLKAFSSWNATETIQVCRESCGGQGYMAENRFAALKADTDVFTTFEGDNTVLLQLVAKGLLTELKQQFHDMKLFGVIKYLARRTATTVAELNPVVTRLADESHLRDPEFHAAAFEYRERRLLRTVASRIKSRIDAGTDSYSAFIECQTHLIKLAKAHIEQVILQQFFQGLENINDVKCKRALSKLYSLFALSLMDNDSGWFLSSGYIEDNKAKAIRRQVEVLCAELRPDARNLVNSFGIPDELLAAPIADLEC